MATTSQWVAAARPRTLPAAVAPVAAGTGAAVAIDGPAVGPATQVGLALLALVVSLALQVGVNYANDYSDGIRGTDDDRVGPFRLTGSGSAPPGRVLRAALVWLGIAAAIGLGLVVVSALVVTSASWWLLPVGAAALAAAWGYTGGRSPYGYRGLGEVAVFVFFGLVAVLGTTFTQAGRLSWAAVAAAVGIGCLACALLVANNLRDVPTDVIAGKRTLAVRWGETATRRLFVALLTLPFVLAALVALAHPWALLTFVAAPLAVGPLRVVGGGARGLGLLPALAGTGRLELVYGIGLGLGLALGQSALG